jgi:hypothetical protein
MTKLDLKTAQPLIDSKEENVGTFLKETRLDETCGIFIQLYILCN